MVAQIGHAYPCRFTPMLRPGSDPLDEIATQRAREARSAHQPPQLADVAGEGHRCLLCRISSAQQDDVLFAAQLGLDGRGRVCPGGRPGVAEANRPSARSSQGFWRPAT